MCKTAAVPSVFTVANAERLSEQHERAGVAVPVGAVPVGVVLCRLAWCWRRAPRASPPARPEGRCLRGTAALTQHCVAMGTRRLIGSWWLWRTNDTHHQ